MKAAYIHMLLHHHMTPEAYPWVAARTYKDGLTYLQGIGLLDMRAQTTPKGAAFIDRLKAYADTLVDE